MKYNTIIFDLDGTLLNTLEDLTDSVNFALDEMGFPKRTIFEISSFVGNGVGKLIELAVPKGTKNSLQCLEIFKNHYSTNMKNKTKPYDGIIELLQKLNEKKYKVAVVSNKYDQAVKSLCYDFFGDYINIAIGATETIKRKPAPDTVIKALNELNSSKEEAIFVGDSDVDIKTAKNCFMKSVGVTWGFRSKEILLKEGADFIIDAPKNLLEIV